MPVYYNSNKLGKIRYGNNAIGKIYYGSNLVYTSYREVDLGLITINGTGSYMYNYYCNAHAILIYDGGVRKLKITGYWRSLGDNVASNVQNFSTNINVGAQGSQKNFTVYEYFRVTEPSGSVYRTQTSFVATNGTLYLPLAQENEWHVFNQFDYSSQVITLD